MKPFQSLFTIPLMVGTLAISVFPSQAQSQALPESQQLAAPNGLLIAQAFKPPKRGTPVTTAGGATRGSCEAKSKQLTSLLPKEKLGLTIAERPTLFWAIPRSVANTAQLTILGDKESRVVYETTLSLPKTTGIMQFTLPKDAPALEVGKPYRWFLSINCKADGSGNEMSVDGWIERIALPSELAKALKTADPKQQVKIYAEAGIWHEALTTLATLRLSQPKDFRLNASWRELLRSVGLTSIMFEPLISNNQTAQR
jgi:hypothetical protein